MASRIAPTTVRVVPSISLSATLPVKPSVTTTSASPATSSFALDVAGELERRAVEGGQARMGLGDAGRALLRLLADVQQADARALDTDHALA